MKKPDATTIITPENFREVVWPLPVEELLYVVHIPAYPDSESGFIRTRYRQHPDSNPEASGHLSGDSIVL